MRKSRTVGLAVILLLFYVLALTGNCLAAFPLPPKLDDTVWEGNYDLSNYDSYRTGNMVLTIQSSIGSLFRGKIVLDSGEPVYFSGVFLDGELRMTVEEGVLCARLVYDKIASSAIWKLTGYWQDSGSHFPDRPRTIWFVLKKD